MIEVLQRSEKTCSSVYAKLALKNKETRVLLLHPGADDSTPIICSLEIMTLAPEASHKYTALSYVWGNPDVVKNITVNDVDFTVTTNLAAALLQIRSTNSDTFIWADAICINQSNISERNQQVLLMKDIYSKANHVLGWLGTDYEGGSQALHDLDQLFAAVIQAPANFGWVDSVSELLIEDGTFPGTQKGVESFRSNIRLENIRLLLKRSFWKRIWIVQEMVIPTRLKLCCGAAIIELVRPDLFHSVVTLLTKLSLAGRPETLTFNIQNRMTQSIISIEVFARLRRQFHDSSGTQHSIRTGISALMNARARLEQHKASDARDHVYGLLGFIDLDIQPDYSESHTIEQVYIEVARLGLETDFPDTLSFAGIKESKESTDDSMHQLDHQILPSWVPDWRLGNPSTLRVWRYPDSHAYPAEGGIQMHVVDEQWLQGEAVIWDVVSKTEAKAGWDLSEWDLFASTITNDPDTWQYPSGIARLQANISLWVGGHDGTVNPQKDLDLDSELFKSYVQITLRYILTKAREIYSPQEIAMILIASIGIQQFRAMGNPLNSGHSEAYIGRSRQVRYGLRCFHTEKGYVGFGPLAVEPGNRVCIIKGHKSPVLLRRCGSHYIFVGDCDVVGIMNGEVLKAVEGGDATVEEIEIR